MNWHNVLIVTFVLSGVYIIFVGLWQLMNDGTVERDVKCAFAVLALSLILVAGV